MSSPERKPVSDIKVNVSNLYREEVFTDLTVATIRRLLPVKADGSLDTSRPSVFVGETTVMSGAGTVPIQCPLEAKTLEEAIAKFPEAINSAVQELIAEVRRIQRQEASRIVVPRTGPGGKIQLG